MENRLRDLEPSEPSGGDHSNGQSPRMNPALVPTVAGLLGVCSVMIREPIPAYAVQLLFAGMVIVLTDVAAFCLVGRIYSVPVGFWLWGRMSDGNIGADCREPLLATRYSNRRVLWRSYLRPLASAFVVAAPVVGFVVWITFFGSVEADWVKRELKFAAVVFSIVIAVVVCGGVVTRRASQQPIDPANLRRRVFAALSAGPLACVGISMACLGSLFLGVGRESEWVAKQLMITAIISVLLCIGGLARGSPKSYWALLMRLLHTGPDADRLAAQFVLLHLTWRRAIAAEGDSVNMAVGKEDGSIEYFDGRRIRYVWLLDCGRIDEAECELVWLLGNSFPGRPYTLLCLEAAFFAAYFRKDVLTARKYIAAAGKVARADFYAELSATAAVALAQGCFEKFFSTATKALDETSSHPWVANARLTRERMRLLLSEAESQC